MQRSIENRWKWCWRIVRQSRGTYTKWNVWWWYIIFSLLFSFFLGGGGGWGLMKIALHGIFNSFWFVLTSVSRYFFILVSLLRGQSKKLLWKAETSNEEYAFARQCCRSRARVECHVHVLQVTHTCCMSRARVVHVCRVHLWYVTRSFEKFDWLKSLKSHQKDMQHRGGHFCRFILTFYSQTFSFDPQL